MKADKIECRKAEKENLMVCKVSDGEKNLFASDKVENVVIKEVEGEVLAEYEGTEPVYSFAGKLVCEIEKSGENDIITCHGSDGSEQRISRPDWL